MADMEPIITRLAPSPTGSQHLGNARTYLASWLFARASGGRVVLRIEDIDSPRVKSDATQGAIEDLRWLGLDWDGEIIVQSRRLPAYEVALEQLRSAELVYPCTCTRSDIDRAASAPHADGVETPYPGTCAGRRAFDLPSDDRYAWRFRVNESPRFDDLYCGSVAIDLRRDGGDYVVWKSSNSPGYQLAVVVDDSDEKITHVIRGDDLIASTPRQLLLYRALGLRPPNFIHLPLVVGPDGRRLAKRHGDTRLKTMREAGVSAPAILGLLAWSCGWLDAPSPINAQDLVSHFDLAKIPRQPFVASADAIASLGFKQRD